ncbi:MAG: hypothetical protein R3220_11755, partial [Balneolaceae bacterium]|nr:hypothetical protein [Balneolaceae bacterium]
TYLLKKVSDNRIEFKAAPKMYVAFTALIVLGIAAIIKFSAEPSGSMLYYGGLGLGLVFVITGVLKMFTYSEPLKFDKVAGYFWRGKKEDPAEAEEKYPLKKIHAIQLIEERLRSSGNSGSSTYFSFELNLVLENSKRVNVVDHGTLSRIRKDAVKLGEFLDVPVWDAINRKS